MTMITVRSPSGHPAEAPGSRLDASDRVPGIGLIRVVDGEPVARLMTARRTDVYDGQSLPSGLHQPNRLHQAATTRRPVTGRVVDMDRPETGWAMVPITPVLQAMDALTAVSAAE